MTIRRPAPEGVTGRDWRPPVLQHAGTAVTGGVLPGPVTSRAVLDRVVPASMAAAEHAELRARP
jgi:hypothetical protein